MSHMLKAFTVAALLAMAPLALTAGTADAAKGQKICKHKMSSGKIKTWTCGKDQPCCAAEMINYYTCGSKLLGCL